MMAAEYSKFPPLISSQVGSSVEFKGRQKCLIKLQSQKKVEAWPCKRKVVTRSARVAGASFKWFHFSRDPSMATLGATHRLLPRMHKVVPFDFVSILLHVQENVSLERCQSRHGSIGPTAPELRQSRKGFIARTASCAAKSTWWRIRRASTSTTSSHRVESPCSSDSRNIFDIPLGIQSRQGLISPCAPPGRAEEGKIYTACNHSRRRQLGRVSFVLFVGKGIVQLSFD